MRRPYRGATITPSSWPTGPGPATCRRDDGEARRLSNALGGYACVAIGKGYSWNLAFGLTAIVMTISVITFAFSQRYLGPIGRSPLSAMANTNKRRWLEWGTYGGSLVIIPILVKMVSKTDLTDWFMYIIGPLTLVYLAWELKKLKREERTKLFAAMVFIIFSIVFWAFFEQSGGSLSLFAANNLRDTLFGVHLDPNGVNNSANSLFVIAFSPLVGIAWVALAKKKREPNTVVKFGLGFLFLSGAFFILYATRFFANAQGITSLEVFTLVQLVMTFGELCLSPIGLSIMTKLSPRSLQGVMMGMWFLASAYGQYVAGLLGAGMTSPAENATAMDKLVSYTDGYRQLGIYGLIAAVLMLALSPFVRRMMGDVK